MQPKMTIKAEEKSVSCDEEGEYTIKLYEKFNWLAYWFRYQATYLEMKYHLRQVMNGKEDSYIKKIGHYDRNIGKTAALARLSAKYGIAVIVPTERWKRVIETDIPVYLPKYFKRNKPIVWVANLPTRGVRQDIVLMEERLTLEQIEIVNRMSQGKIVGYQNIS